MVGDFFMILLIDVVTIVPALADGWTGRKFQSVTSPAAWMKFHTGAKAYLWVLCVMCFLCLM